MNTIKIVNLNKFKRGFNVSKKQNSICKVYFVAHMVYGAYEMIYNTNEIHDVNEWGELIPQKPISEIHEYVIAGIIGCMRGLCRSVTMPFALVKKMTIYIIHKLNKFKNDKTKE